MPDYRPINGGSKKRAAINNISSGGNNDYNGDTTIYECEPMCECTMKWPVDGQMVYDKY